MLAKLFRLALKHIATNPERESSARLCLESARNMEEAGNVEAAERWLRKSLGHSIGVLHPDFPR